MRILEIMFCILTLPRIFWKDLEGRFGQSNKARSFQVQKEVSCLTQGDLDIAGCYTRATQLWDESSAVGSGGATFSLGVSMAPHGPQKKVNKV